MNIRLIRFLPIFPGLFPGALSAAEPPAAALKDKTLVVWASPANLTQRGGSALTIEDGEEHFDGIVFGELSPAKWMAGSDFFRRTEQNQADWPAETAPPGTFVQIAIVYEGQEITVLRNGEIYSRYRMASAPQEFPSDSLVVIGRRHQRSGDAARFAGVIDDARIYDRALTAEDIAALEADKEADLKPWAWWSFDDPSGKEGTGRFVETKLMGGAKIEDGKLVLDGKTGTLLARVTPEPPFTYETPARPAEVPDDWLTFHLAHPGPGNAMPGDPNCAFYWKGRYHLHYIYTHRHGFSFAHVSSSDLLHWKWHRTTLTPPKTGHGMFSGTGFYTKEGRPAIIYHGEGSGRNQIALALDDELETWSEPMPVEPDIRPGQDASKIAHWDPDAWLDGDFYYALSGGSPGSGKPPTLFKSSDLKQWDYLELFLTRDMPDVQPDEDISCPNFFKIGNKHMLLCISHNKGCRYYLGEWKNEKFTPDFHARMSWGGLNCFAPESVPTPDGRRVMWAWCLFSDPAKPQSGMQTLPRELSLPEDGVLRIQPLRELAQLRGAEQREADVTVSPGAPQVLSSISGDALELAVTLEPAAGAQCSVVVYADADGKDGLPIRVSPQAGTISLGDVSAPLSLAEGEAIQLRVFLDKNVVEVFANERQAMVASHFAAPDHRSIALTSEGGDTRASGIRGWTMKSIYDEPEK